MAKCFRRRGYILTRSQNCSDFVLFLCYDYDIFDIVSITELTLRMLYLTFCDICFLHDNTHRLNSDAIYSALIFFSQKKRVGSQ